MKSILAVAMIAATAGSASAIDLVYTWDAVDSWDAEGSPNNEVFSYVIDQEIVITDVAFEGTVETVGGSWQSEATILHDTPNPDQVLYLTMAAGVGEPGSGTYSGAANLADVGLPNIEFLPGDTLGFEFFESYDDVEGEIDAYWTNVTLTLSGYVVPAPASAALLGMGALVARRRR